MLKPIHSYERVEIINISQIYKTTYYKQESNLICPNIFVIQISLLYNLKESNLLFYQN